MTCFEAKPDEALLQKLISLSADWEAEQSTYGYRKNDPGDIEPNRIFLAQEGECLLGYLFGHREQAKNASSVMAEGTAYFEIEELYVVPEQRSRGIGRALYRHVEEVVKSEGMEYILLSTATKDYKSILHFYIDELGMDFWSARLFKRIQE